MLWVQRADSYHPPGGLGGATTWSQRPWDPSHHTGKTGTLRSGRGLSSWDQESHLHQTHPYSWLPPWAQGPPKEEGWGPYGSCPSSSLPPYLMLFSACLSSSFCLQPSIGGFLTASPLQHPHWETRMACSVYGTHTPGTRQALFNKRADGWVEAEREG